jgi:hypothetical protein
MSKRVTKKHFNPGDPPQVLKDRMTPQRQAKWRAFIKTIERTGNRAAAYRASGFHPKYLRVEIRKNEWMQDEIEQAEALFGAQLERAALRMALGKLKRPILFKGRQVRLKNPDTNKFEDAFEDIHFPQVLLAMLKAHMSEKYRSDSLRLDQPLEVKEVKGVSPDDL